MAIKSTWKFLILYMVAYVLIFSYTGSYALPAEEKEKGEANTVFLALMYDELHYPWQIISTVDKKRMCVITEKCYQWNV